MAHWVTLAPKAIIGRAQSVQSDIVLSHIAYTSPVTMLLLLQTIIAIKVFPFVVLQSANNLHFHKGGHVTTFTPPKSFSNHPLEVLIHFLPAIRLAPLIYLAMMPR